MASNPVGEFVLPFAQNRFNFQGRSPMCLAAQTSAVRICNDCMQCGICSHPHACTIQPAIRHALFPLNRELLFRTRTAARSVTSFGILVGASQTSYSRSGSSTTGEHKDTFRRRHMLRGRKEATGAFTGAGTGEVQELEQEHVLINAPNVAT